MYQTKQINIMNYQEFILEALKSTEKKPTKDEMQFAYIVLHQGFGLNPSESIKESISLSV